MAGWSLGPAPGSQSRPAPRRHPRPPRGCPSAVYPPDGRADALVPGQPGRPRCPRTVPPPGWLGLAPVPPTRPGWAERLAVRPAGCHQHVLGPPTDLAPRPPRRVPRAPHPRSRQAWGSVARHPAGRALTPRAVPVVRPRPLPWPDQVPRDRAAPGSPRANRSALAPEYRPGGFPGRALTPLPPEARPPRRVVPPPCRAHLAEGSASPKAATRTHLGRPSPRRPRLRPRPLGSGGVMWLGPCPAVLQDPGQLHPRLTRTAGTIDADPRCHGPACPVHLSGHSLGTDGRTSRGHDPAGACGTPIARADDTISSRGVTATRRNVPALTRLIGCSCRPGARA